MRKLLMIADDFTGALDAGVQFAARGAKTCVETDPAFDFSRAQPEVQVLILDAETRHMEPADAYRTVFRITADALAAGFTHIYKKTDSALRGNIGAELSAVLHASGGDVLHFLPAFPKMNRVTRNGIHYIDSVPVARSVFGQDPFEPVTASGISEVIALQSHVPVALYGQDALPPCPSIQVYDAETDEDLARVGRRLGQEGLRLSAGCAGFAAVLAQTLELEGSVPPPPALRPSLLIACGSVNPVTLRQMKRAEEAGFVHIHLKPAQKLESGWLETPDCAAAVQSWLAAAQRSRRCILDVNDPEGRNDTAVYAGAHGLTTEDLRVRISAQLGQLTRRLLEAGLESTILCTGGDTLLALMRAVGVSGLIPVRELETGVVLTYFVYGGKTYHIISKSGGFGVPELFCALADAIGVKREEEDTAC